MTIIDWLVFFLLVFIPMLIYFEAYRKQRHKSDAEILALLKENNQILSKLVNKE